MRWHEICRRQGPQDQHVEARAARGLEAELHARFFDNKYRGDDTTIVRLQEVATDGVKV